MIEVDLNNGMYRKVDLDKPVFCAKCGKEIVRDSNSINLNINVHACGYAFCKDCKKKLNEFAGKKVEEYEKELVKQFVENTKEVAFEAEADEYILNHPDYTVFEIDENDIKKIFIDGADFGLKRAIKNNTLD